VRRLLVPAVGKAAGPLAKAEKELLGDRIDGLAVLKDGHSAMLRRVR
jgi:glycerate-2-kinase